jgi:hypothetical protein
MWLRVCLAVVCTAACADACFKATASKPCLLGIRYEPAAVGAALECHPNAPGGCTVCDKCCNDFIPDGNQCAACVKRDCAPTPAPSNTPAFIAMDPATLEVTDVLKGNAGDFVNSGLFGTVDQAKGVYYSLKQPLGTSGIHLSSFSLPDKHETVIPLQTTVAAAHFHDGSILGVDEDKDGVYVALIDPLTGKATAKTTLGKFNFAPTIALDKENSIAYISPGSDRGTGADDGTVFHLFTFSTLTGKQLRAPVLLHDTPDAQGPSGLTFVSGSTLLAFMPPLGGGWALVAIDAVTGAVSPTAALDNVPAMHVIAPGSSWLMRQPLPGPGASGAAGVASGLVLNAAFGAAPGGPMRMLAVDVACALSALLAPTTSGANCTIGNSPWPAKAGEQAPFDLALYQPPAAAGNTTAGR